MKDNKFTKFSLPENTKCSDSFDDNFKYMLNDKDKQDKLFFYPLHCDEYIDSSKQNFGLTHLTNYLSQSISNVNSQNKAKINSINIKKIEFNKKKLNISNEDGNLISPRNRELKGLNLKNEVNLHTNLHIKKFRPSIFASAKLFRFPAEPLAWSRLFRSDKLLTANYFP